MATAASACASPGYALDELMVVEASRQISDGDTVLVGTGLPLVASFLAQRSHAPNMCFVVETGPVAPLLVSTPISVCDPRVMHRAVRLGSLLDALGGILQRGLADIAFLGGAQIDQFANVNSTVIGDYRKPKVRFPGSGGANDMASHARKILVISRHERRRFPARCDYITSPGYLDGPDGRRRAGLTGSPTPAYAIVTDLCVMEMDKAKGRLKVVKLMPGVSIENVLANTLFEPLVAERLETVEPPTPEHLRLLREEVDPARAYFKGGME